MMVSTAADVWTPESLPFPANRNERGLEGIAARNGLWVACGFDDGAEGTPESPSRVLFLNRGSGWDRIAVPCGGCSNREFGAVAVSAPGGILLGGSITNFAGGADEYTAFLLLRSVAGDWAEIVLPDPEALERVNDILIAADGTLYLACGMETGFLLRWPPGRGIEREAAIPSARIRRLAQAPDGTIWAAGSLQSGENGEARPAVWRRKT
jgi:hypothetical protein